MKVIPETRRVP